METSSFKQAIEAQFDCLSKKVIKRAIKKGYRDMKRRENENVHFPIYQIMSRNALEKMMNTQVITRYLTF